MAAIFTLAVKGRVLKKYEEIFFMGETFGKKYFTHCCSNTDAVDKNVYNIQNEL